MPESISIYLAGRIKKAHEPSNEVYWSDQDMLELQQNVDPLKIHFLNPAERNDDLSVAKSAFGRGMTQVFCSDAVVVDARDRCGLGVGAEMVWAKMHNIPVITLAPKESFYSKSKVTILDKDVENWVHPFVLNLSDQVATSLEEVATALKKIKSGEIISKSDDYIRECMAFYVDTQLERDTPMLKLSQESTSVEKRINLIKKKTPTKAA